MCTCRTLYAIAKAPRHWSSMDVYDPASFDDAMKCVVPRSRHTTAHTALLIAPFLTSLHVHRAIHPPAAHAAHAADAAHANIHLPHMPVLQRLVIETPTFRVMTMHHFEHIRHINVVAAKSNIVTMLGSSPHLTTCRVRTAKQQPRTRIALHPCASIDILEFDIDENVDEIVGENVGENVDEIVGEIVGENVDENVGEIVGENVGGNVGDTGHPSSLGKYLNVPRKINRVIIHTKQDLLLRHAMPRIRSLEVLVAIPAMYIDIPFHVAASIRRRLFLGHDEDQPHGLLTVRIDNVPSILAFSALNVVVSPGTTVELEILT